MLSYAKGKMSGMASMVTGSAANQNGNEEEEKDAQANEPVASSVSMFKR